VGAPPVDPNAGAKPAKPGEPQQAPTNPGRSGRRPGPIRPSDGGRPTKTDAPPEKTAPAPTNEKGDRPADVRLGRDVPKEPERGAPPVPPTGRPNRGAKEAAPAKTPADAIAPKVAEKPAVDRALSKPAPPPSRMQSIGRPNKAPRNAPPAGESPSPASSGNVAPAPATSMRETSEHRRAPEGGRTYVGDAYRHEYHRRRRSSVHIDIHIGGGRPHYAYAPVYVAPAYGYAYGHGPVVCHPYWHCPPTVYYGAPVHHAPVYYAPVYAVPAYPVVVEPVTYSTTSFAFGFSSFGGGSFTSFNLGYSSRRFAAAYGWCPTPVYTIYTPVVEPYYRSVWQPGYYAAYDERVWIAGRYVERVQTPVVAAVFDPLGNSYDVVVEAGSVDLVWEPGRYVVESRRVWHPGRFETVAVF
jgi:hypothetical protein